ncbi:MAG: hypothetical protein OJF49_002096 [Ktedonobacterales bacterium]|jgi:hypothetical protein|nr:MAG: hypothetical protein OJF49_002096 [Ktedonobacterales bacterium]
MAKTPSQKSGGSESSDPSRPTDPSDAGDGTRDAHPPEIGTSYTEVEPGWQAVRSLRRLRNDALLAVMLRPSFQPVRDLELVRVLRCPHCGDGGLRTAGSVRARQGRAMVRACDTCAAVEVGERLLNDG